MVNNEIRGLIENLAGECRENDISLDEVFDLMKFYYSSYKTPPKDEIEEFEQKASNFLIKEGLIMKSVRFSRTLSTLVLVYEKSNAPFLMKELARELAIKDSISTSSAQSFLSGNMCFFRDWVRSQKCYDTRFLTSPQYIEIVVSYIKSL